MGFHDVIFEARVRLSGEQVEMIPLQYNGKDGLFLGIFLSPQGGCAAVMITKKAPPCTGQGGA